MPDVFLLHVRRGIPFLSRICRRFCGDTAYLSLEGDLFQAESGDLYVSKEPTAALKRSTLDPSTDFAMIAVSTDAFSL